MSINVTINFCETLWKKKLQKRTIASNTNIGDFLEIIVDENKEFEIQNFQVEDLSVVLDGTFLAKDMTFAAARVRNDSVFEIKKFPRTVEKFGSMQSNLLTTNYHNMNKIKGKSVKNDNNNNEEGSSRLVCSNHSLTNQGTELMSQETVFSKHDFDFGHLEKANNTVEIQCFTADVKDEQYIALLAKTPLDGTNKRAPSNIIIVIDISGSMNAKFEDSDKTRMDLTIEMVVELIKNMKNKEQVAILAFDTEVDIIQTLQFIGMLDREKLIEKVRKLKTRGGTNMEVAMEKAIEIIKEALECDSGEDSEYEDTDNEEEEEYETPKNHRIIFMTDADPNNSSNIEKMFNDTERAANEDEIYTTYIGIGKNFNLKNIKRIAYIKGANFFYVDSENEFKRILTDELNYAITPIAFDIKVFIESKVLEIESVYGVSKTDISNGMVMEIPMLIPSQCTKLGSRDNVMLIKCKEKLTPTLNPNKEARITLRYTQPDGTKQQVVELAQFTGEKPCAGIRKMMILAKYHDLMIEVLNRRGDFTDENFKKEVLAFRRKFRKFAKRAKEQEVTMKLGILEEYIHD